VDYAPSGSTAYGSSLTRRLDGTAGARPAWWPLLPLGLGAGLIVGVLIGVALAAAGLRLSRGVRAAG
jgi:hypothetical protein